MGNRSSIRRQGSLCPSETDLADFKIVRFIGAGAFGKVFVVFHKGLRKEYALKMMQKSQICKRKFADNVISELELLQGLIHPFICSLWYAFQDAEQIYMITDLLTGGDLQYHLKNKGRFSESRAKLLICELVLALGYLHSQRIGHFDVKPANILLDEQGHAHLSDFSLAKRLPEGELTKAFSGTRLYMAPEILLTALGDSPGYDWHVDWWALGVCFYEMLRGRTPYEYPQTFLPTQTLRIIYTRGVTMPCRWPSDLVSFLRAIINPDSSFRIKSFEDLQKHPYMERINWRDVFNRKMIPIFVPPKIRADAHSSRRNYSATISVPFSSHHSMTSSQHNKHQIRQLSGKEHQNSSIDVVDQSGHHSELLEMIANLSARFRNYNRFRCETRIAEPMQCLELAPIKEQTSPRPVSETTRTSVSSKRTASHAGKMRKLFHTANREVNYSM